MFSANGNLDPSRPERNVTSFGCGLPLHFFPAILCSLLTFLSMLETYCLKDDVLLKISHSNLFETAFGNSTLLPDYCYFTIRYKLTNITSKRDMDWSQIIMKRMSI